jgi:voltage-gated sodium channel
MLRRFVPLRRHGGIIAPRRPVRAESATSNAARGVPSGTLPALCARVAAAPSFERATLGAIVANGFVLGLETYPGVESSAGGTLDALNDVFLGVFTLELMIRFAATGFSPRQFLRSGWSVFDAVVVVGAYLPGVRENVTLLRMARLLRVLRLMNVLPEMRVVVHGLTRSVAPMASIGLLTLLLFYLYGIAGWILFSDQDPEHWRTVGQAMLTLFSVLTLEEWVAVQDAALDASSWAWVYFVSFVLLSSVLLLNLVVAVVINSVEEARAAVAEEDRRGAEAGVEGTGALDRLHTLRAHLDDLEQELRRNGTANEWSKVR